MKKAKGQRSLSSIPLCGYWGLWGSSETSTSAQKPRPDRAPQAEPSPSHTGQHSLVRSPTELAHGRGNWHKEVPMSCSRTTEAYELHMVKVRQCKRRTRPYPMHLTGCSCRKKSSGTCIYTIDQLLPCSLAVCRFLKRGAPLCYKPTLSQSSVLLAPTPGVQFSCHSLSCFRGPSSGKVCDLIVISGTLAGARHT